MNCAPFAFACLLAAGCQSSLDHTINDRSVRVQEFIRKSLEADDSPGVQYLVVNRDSTVFAFYGGWADVAGQRTMHGNTTMMIYSMTKTITAAAVLQLVEQQRIGLDDAVVKYIDSVPYGDQVTIRHLLAQTSGIPNPLPLKWVHLVEEHPQFDQQRTLEEILAENPDLAFTPGAEYGYSNISYWLLGRVIERASGVPYEEYVRQNIFERLGTQAGEIGFTISDRQNHAHGYLPRWSFLNLLKPFLIDAKFIGEYEDGWLHIKDHYLNGPAFGGIVASARAIGVFLSDQLQDNSRLFNRATKDLFYRQERNNEGEPVEMTLGWHIRTLDNQRYFYKEGGGGGYHCEMRIYPSFGIGSVVIANNTTFDAREFLDLADREFFGTPEGDR